MNLPDSCSEPDFSTLPAQAKWPLRKPGRFKGGDPEKTARLTLKEYERWLVDEVHHLLAGSAREQRASPNLLKYLANEVKMSVVAVGTSDAPVAFQTDAQIHSRFRPLELPRWTESDDFRRLLAAFELVLPLRKASNLQQRPIAQFILAASGGLLGEVSRLLTKAAEAAIHTGAEQLNLELLEKVAHGRR